MIQAIPHRTIDTGDEDHAYRRVLERRFAHVKEKADALRDRIDRQKAELAALDEESSHLAALLGLAGGSEKRPSQRGHSTGHQPSSADLVAQLIGEEGPLHYRQIYDRFIARGWAVPNGVDPANGLLARYFNDDRLHRPRRGTYALKAASVVPQTAGTPRSVEEAREGPVESSSAGPDQESSRRLIH